MIDTWTFEEIKAFGFEGLYKISDLISNYDLIPNERGVYLIMTSSIQISYLSVGTGGHFKNKNPNIQLDALKRNWVEGACVIYIGQAGGKINGKWSTSTLRGRLKKYFQFGQGKPTAHWGGRLIWQIEDSLDLIICWKVVEDRMEDPCKIERELIRNFREHYKVRPFANLKG